MSPASCLRRSFVLLGVLFAFPALVLGQTNSLEGGDIPISGPLRGDQMFPSAAVGPNGGFVVWQDNITDPSGLGVSARRFSSALAPVGEIIHLNQTMGNDQQRPRISMLNDHGAVAVWQSGKPGAQNIFARFLTAAGGFATGEIMVNDPALEVINRYTTNWVLVRNNHPRSQRYRLREKVKLRHEFNANPAVATLNDGSIVVAYSSSRVFTTNTFGLNETLRWDDRRSIFVTNRVRVPLQIRLDAMQDVYVQRLSAAGQKIGGEFRANEFVEFNQRDTAIAPLDNGNFVVVWVSEQQRFENSVDVYGRVFDALGHALGGEFLVNTVNRSCGNPGVAATPDGGFSIAWTQKALEQTNSLDVHARTFRADGSPSSEPFLVNEFTYGDQFAPSIVSFGSHQVIVWSSMGQDGSWEGVFARGLNGAVPSGSEFRVNVSTPFSQVQPRIAADRAGGRAVVVWSGYGVDTGFDLYGRLYMAP